MNHNSDEPRERETMHGNTPRKNVSISHLSMSADKGGIPLADQKPNGSLMSGHSNHEHESGTTDPIKTGTGLTQPGPKRPGKIRREIAHSIISVFH